MDTLRLVVSKKIEVFNRRLVFIQMIEKYLKGRNKFQWAITFKDLYQSYFQNENREPLI